MPRVTAAEWFLSLFTTRDRASAIAGDLLEQRRASWLNILRIGASLFLRSVIAQPLSLSLLILLGLILHIVAANVAGIPIRFGFITRLPSAKFYWLVSMSIVAPAFIGHVIARLARGPEITACFVLVAISTCIFGDVIAAFFLLAAGALTRKRALTRQLSHVG